MSKSKQGSGSDERARAPYVEPTESPRQAREDECCALLRRYPIAAPGSIARRRRAQANGEDKRT